MIAASRQTGGILRPLVVVAAACAACIQAELATAVTYTNVTAAAGINYRQNFNVAPGALLQTGGAAAADYDNDGWVDLYVTRLNGADILYRNQGNGTFQNVAAAAGFTAGLPTNGPAWGDIDNDGDKDLYVTSAGSTGTGATRYYLYINDGNGHFTEEAVARSADIGGVFRYGMSVTFGDYDNDGYLDIHTNDWGIDKADSTSRLLRNLGAANPGHFEDVTAAAGLDVYRQPFFYGRDPDSNGYRFSSTFSDLDRDGHVDLAIAGDFKTSQIFWNNGDGTFTDGTVAAGVGADEDGMGTTIGDYDGDGKLDWFISALVDVPGQQSHAGNFLYRNNGNRTFTDTTNAAGVRNSGWSWGTTFLDQDNDRDLDLFVTNGWDPSLPDQSHVYRNDGGVFTDVSNASGVTDDQLGRGLLSFDYDNDGDLDVFMVNHGNTQPILYRNDGGNANDWLKIKLHGTESNRDGIGALITIDPDANVVGDEFVREINAGSNFLSQNDLTAHIGLGLDADPVDLITVKWPSGFIQSLSNVAANQVINLTEGGAPGDFNNDGIVNGNDFLAWQRGASPSPLSASDLAAWRSHFPTATPVVVQVPEPTALVLLLMGLLGFRVSRPAKLS